MARETWVQSQVESYQRLKKWYLMPPCLTLSIIRYGSRVKWSNPEKKVAPFLTPWCSSYRKGSLRVTLDYGRQLYFTHFVGTGIFILIVDTFFCVFDDLRSRYLLSPLKYLFLSIFYIMTVRRWTQLQQQVSIFTMLFIVEKWRVPVTLWLAVTS